MLIDSESRQILAIEAVEAAAHPAGPMLLGAGERNGFVPRSEVDTVVLARGDNHTKGLVSGHDCTPPFSVVLAASSEAEVPCVKSATLPPK